MADPTLAQLLRRAGVTRAAAAEILDVSLQTVTNWSVGRNSPDLTRLGTIVELLLDRGIELDTVKGFFFEHLEGRGLPPGVLNRLFLPTSPAQADIAIVSWVTANPGQRATVESFERIMERSGRKPVVFECLRNPRLLRNVFGFVSSAPNFRGIMVFGPLLETFEPGEIQALADRAADHGSDIVLIASYPEDTEDLDVRNLSTIFWNQTKIARYATRFVISQGHRSIGAIFHGNTISFHRTSFDGFVNALTESGLAYSEEQVIWRVGPDRTKSPMDEEIRRLISNCSAVLIDDPGMLPEVVSALHAARVPATKFTLAVLGFPPISYSDKWPAYCILLPNVELGRLAGHVMLGMLNRLSDGAPKSQRITYDEAPQILHLGRPDQSPRTLEMSEATAARERSE